MADNAPERDARWPIDAILLADWPTMVRNTYIFHSVRIEVFWLEERRCSIQGNGTELHYGDEIEVTVTPDNGFHFVGWSDDMANTNPVRRCVTVTPLKEEYHMDERVDLVATPAEGWRFAGWHSRYWSDSGRETSVDIYRILVLRLGLWRLWGIRAEGSCFTM